MTAGAAGTSPPRARHWEVCKALKAADRAALRLAHIDRTLSVSPPSPTALYDMGGKRANKPTEWLPILHLLVNVGILVCLIVIARRMTELSDGVANVDPAKLEASVRNGVSSGIATGIPGIIPAVVGLVNGLSRRRPTCSSR